MGDVEVDRSTEQNHQSSDGPLVSLSNPIHFFSINSFLLNIRDVLFLVLLSNFERYFITVTLSKKEKQQNPGSVGHL